MSRPTPSPEPVSKRKPKPVLVRVKPETWKELQLLRESPSEHLADVIERAVKELKAKEAA